MKTTRTPQQKRSIEKRTKILEAAFILFSEKGFENTNTAEISQHAGVATGTLYSYFQDKVDIYKTVFESYLKKEVSKMLSELECEINNHTNISQFILLWKDSYLSLFGKPNRSLKARPRTSPQAPWESLLAMEQGRRSKRSGRRWATGAPPPPHL